MVWRLSIIFMLVIVGVRFRVIKLPRTDCIFNLLTIETPNYLVLLSMAVMYIISMMCLERTHELCFQIILRMCFTVF